MTTLKQHRPTGWNASLSPIALLTMLACIAAGNQAHGESPDMLAARFAVSMNGYVFMDVKGKRRVVVDSADDLQQDLSDRKVTALRVVEGTLTKSDVEVLAKLDELTSLEFASFAMKDDDLQPLAAAASKQMISIDFEACPITGDGLKHLGDLKSISKLYLRNCPIEGQNLIYVKTFTNLKFLSLNDTKVDDNGLAHLSGLPMLLGLNLKNTAVTDAGLVHLSKITSLAECDLRGTRVTQDGVNKLQAALPKLKIRH